MSAGFTENTTWPPAKFYFTVTGIPGDPVFQEVTGLEAVVQPFEYRHGNEPSFYPIKMPGLGRVGNVTMKNGTFVNDKKLSTWFKSISMNTVARSTITIQLMDNDAKARYQWVLNNAFPTKFSGTDLESDGNEVAIESIEIAYETMTAGAPAPE